MQQLLPTKYAIILYCDNHILCSYYNAIFTANELGPLLWEIYLMH